MLYGHWGDQNSDQSNVPDRVYMAAPELSEEECLELARRAVAHAQRFAPKLSGQSARRFQPVARDGWFGIHWVGSHVWFQEVGIRPFTMNSLAGKTIPMWLNDESGELRQKHPKAETRTTADGRVQVLQFRKAANKGDRKMALRRRGGTEQWVSVPASYPGAPGRIALRRPDGTIAPGNTGVRWRHPGMQPKGFLYDGLTLAAFEAGLAVRDVIATNERFS